MHSLFRDQCFLGAAVCYGRDYGAVSCAAGARDWCHPYLLCIHDLNPDDTKSQLITCYTYEEYCMI